MATVTQVLRTNIDNAINELKEFGYKIVEKVKVKALGGGEYRIWCGTWDYLPSSEDATDEDAMHKMVKNFIEWTTDLDIENIKTVGSHYLGSHHDYSLVAGDADGYFVENAIQSIDCRIENYENSTLADFWSSEYSELQAALEEIIDGSGLVVYHRKGKDWTIAPQLSAFEASVYILDEDRDINEDWYHSVTGEMTCSITGLEEKVEKLASFIQSTKDDLELRGIIYKFVTKACSMESFLSVYLDEDALRDTAFEFCNNYYQENNTGMKMNIGFNGDLPDVEDRETFEEFLKEFEMFKHQPELALKDSSKLYRLGEKLGFYTQFEFSKDTVSVEFVVGEEEYSVHVDANEFDEHDLNWMTVYRQVVIPQVNRRRFLAQLSSIKRQIGGDLKSFAKKVWVRFEDSLTAGNCRSGSEYFMRRHNISLESLGAIRGDWLLEMENTEFTQRIIYSAAAQHPELLEA